MHVICSLIKEQTVLIVGLTYNIIYCTIREVDVTLILKILCVDGWLGHY